MKIRVKKWSGSAVVRIPTSAMAAASISAGQAVDIREDGGRIIIEPIRATDLDQLLDQMMSESFHEQVDFGAPVGREAW